MRKVIEWFFMLFVSKKAEQLRRQAFIERENAVRDYHNAKISNEKYLSKYSGKKRYVKTGGI